MDAAALPASEPVTIGFAIGSGRRTIAPSYALPDVARDHLRIDATSQPGFDPADPRPLIVLDGGKVGRPPDAPGSRPWTDGLRLTGTGDVVRGLDIIRFTIAGVRISGGTGDTVVGCYLGLDPTGVYALGNHIGIDATGRFPLGNAFGGLVLADTSSDLVGGLAPWAANVIADHRGRGVWLRNLSGFSVADSILSNRIYGNDGPPIALGSFGDFVGVSPGAKGTGSNDIGRQLPPSLLGVDQTSAPARRGSCPPRPRPCWRR